MIESIARMLLVILLLAGALKRPLDADRVDQDATLDGMTDATMWQVTKVFQSGRSEVVGVFAGDKHAVAAEISRRCARGRFVGQPFDPVMEFSADGHWMRARKPGYDGKGSSEGRKVFAYEAVPALHTTGPEGREAPETERVSSSPDPFWKNFGQ